MGEGIARWMKRARANSAGGTHNIRLTMDRVKMKLRSKMRNQDVNDVTLSDMPVGSTTGHGAESGSMIPLLLHQGAGMNSLASRMHL